MTVCLSVCVLQRAHRHRGMRRCTAQTMVQHISSFSPATGGFLNTGLKLQETAPIQGKKLSQGGGMDGNGQKMQPAFPQGNIQEFDVCSCCRERTGTHTFLILSHFFNPARSAQILRMIPRPELLGMHMRQVSLKLSKGQWNIPEQCRCLANHPWLGKTAGERHKHV